MQSKIWHPVVLQSEKKRDVQKYLRQQQKEASEPMNNAFAQALAQIKLEK